MFVVLDTDHFTALVAGGAFAGRIERRAGELDADLFSTVVTAQEVVQGGWPPSIASGRVPAN